jgi:hypothetical protein
MATKIILRKDYRSTVDLQTYVFLVGSGRSLAVLCELQPARMVFGFAYRFLTNVVSVGLQENFVKSEIRGSQ